MRTFVLAAVLHTNRNFLYLPPARFYRKEFSAGKPIRQAPSTRDQCLGRDRCRRLVAQRGFDAYPDYCPYPMAHGTPYKTFGTAWTDAGIICPWTMWKVSGDTRALERHWATATT
jgi:Bacterial alpha-L-rhamnosidase 6 hairpin glycosidase domain